MRWYGAVVLSALVALGASTGATAESPGSSHEGGAPAPEGRIVYGRFVAYGEPELLHVLGRDQPGERMIGDPVDCGTCVSVSADGQQLVTLTLAPDGTFTFVVMGSDGSGRRVFPLPPGMGFGPGPFIGEWIYVQGWESSAPPAYGVYRVKAADFSGLEQVIAAPQGVNFNPVIASPDGTHLVVFQAFHGNEEHGLLHLVDLRSGSVRRLNPGGTRVPWIPSVGAPASFSPDSRHVAFGGYEGDQGPNIDPEASAVYVADVDGGDARRISSVGTGTTSARWSPTGDEIAFQRRQDGFYGVYLIKPEGSGEHVVDTGTAGTYTSAWTPVWSPSGDWLVVQRGTPFSFDLWAMHPDGGALRQLTADPIGRGGVVWAP
jgi:TolB protein